MPFPSTTRRAMTLIEVMISVMVFAILLSAVASGWFSLRSAQKFAQENAKVYELARVLSERIVGANWDWIGRDRPDEMTTVQITDPNDATKKISKEITERYWRRCAWSWHRRETKRNSTATVRLPPLTDHDWTSADYVRFRADSAAPMSTSDVDKFNSSESADYRVNPHNLVSLGVIDKLTGLPNLQVYVEYYRSEALDALFTQANTSVVTFWKNLTTGRGNEALLLPESPFSSEAISDQMNLSDSALAQKAVTVRIIITWGETPKIRRHEVVLTRRK